MFGDYFLVIYLFIVVTLNQGYGYGMVWISYRYSYLYIHVCELFYYMCTIASFLIIVLWMHVAMIKILL